MAPSATTTRRDKASRRLPRISPEYGRHACSRGIVRHTDDSSLILGSGLGAPFARESRRVVGRTTGVVTVPGRETSAMENDGARQLRNPVLIAAFEGWNDAGEAATAGIEHLERVWNAGAVAALDPDEYYDFQVNRPLVSVDDDGKRSIEWPTTRLSVVSIEEHGRDIVLLRGIEPNMRWRAFCAELLSVATDLGVRAGRHARRAAGRRAAHPAGARHRHHQRPRPGRDARARAVPLRGPHRHRRRVPGRRRPRRPRRRVALGGRAPLRRPVPVPQGHAGAAAAGRGPPRPRRCRWATSPSRPRPGSTASMSSPRKTPTSPSTSAASKRRATPSTSRGLRRAHRPRVRALPPPPRHLTPAPPRMITFTTRFPATRGLQTSCCTDGPRDVTASAHTTTVGLRVRAKAAWYRAATVSSR